ncbi:helix-turn-helix domain-containing protein [Nocardia huaxiensis]|uniref:Helix-turn-helix domain-containing protein n=1 Tax=Nocardia huaxiensis TaxID=2755382 RepID=A0A7D6VD06_9NOCA|nr:helix-turn-helix domain-containing protein [Nocardia huaxiensis]QLY29957.1 helix-turn-helix domain-containing protein [Nocardia huaxiensis]UFS96459.1 helix-turn-helix domain-containing protein [Nocardia huaxiensis]
MPAGKTRMTETSPPTQRVLSIVELLAAQHGPLSSAEIADALELNRSTAGSILTALAERGWVRRLPDLSYELGPALVAVGLRAADSNSDRARLEAELERLGERVDCGAALTTVTGDQVEFLAVTRDRLTAGIETGARLPLLAPAGAAIIAHSSLARQQDWLATGEPGSRAEQQAVLETLRTAGFCAWRLEPDSLPTARVLSDVADHLAEHPSSKELHGRVLAQLATIIGSAYDRATFDSDAALPLSYMSAPVFDGNGHTVMELKIGPLRVATTRAERRRYLTELEASARRIGGSLDPKHQVRH